MFAVGKPTVRPPSVARRDGAANLIRAGQEVVGITHAAALEQPTHHGARGPHERLIGQRRFNLAHDIDVEPETGADRTQGVDVAAAAPAESEVAALHNVPGSKGVDDVPHELRRVESQELGVWLEAVDLVCPSFLQQGRPLLEGGQQGRRPLRLQDRERMRIEAQHHDAAARARELAGALNQGDMPEMHAVEVADGDRRLVRWHPRNIDEPRPGIDRGAGVDRGPARPLDYHLVSHRYTEPHHEAVR